MDFVKLENWLLIFSVVMLDEIQVKQGATSFLKQTIALFMIPSLCRVKMKPKQLYDGLSETLSQLCSECSDHYCGAG